jgi:hypothetical protein
VVGPIAGRRVDAAVAQRVAENDDGTITLLYLK